jgi:hypothetical protein
MAFQAVMFDWGFGMGEDKCRIFGGGAIHFPVPGLILGDRRGICSREVASTHVSKGFST